MFPKCLSNHVVIINRMFIKKNTYNLKSADLFQFDVYMFNLVD